METLVKRPKTIVEKMAADKKKLEEYVKTGDATKKPDGIRFVKPFSVPDTGK